jgi:hypothetical protein
MGGKWRLWMSSHIGDTTLARIFHKGIEQKSGRSVRKLENTELYDDTLYRPEHHRL